MSKRPVIIDCDPGHDDAIALILAFGSGKLDVRAITTTAGNQTLEKTYINAIKVCKFIGQDVRIAKGLAKPLTRELITAPEVHGDTGLDGPELPVIEQMPKLEKSLDVMREVLEESEEKITLIPTGPLTNIALLLTTYPELKEKIDEIIIMGGAATLGNWTPAAEFNILVDPEAAEIVFKSGIPVVMCGLEVTHEAQIYKNEVEEIRSMGRIGQFMAELLDFFDVFHKLHPDFAFEGPPVHDVCAVAYAIDPTIFEGKEYHVDVECDGKHTLGRTVVDYYNVQKLDKNVKVIFDVDREELLNRIKEAINVLN